MFRDMDNQLQNKLLQYAPEPPEKVWDAICSTLDKEGSIAFVEKLYQYNETPPADVWEKIGNRLQAQSKVAPLVIKYRRVITYAAAAVIILAIISTGLFKTNRTQSTVMATVPIKTPGLNDKKDSNNINSSTSLNHMTVSEKPGEEIDRVRYLALDRKYTFSKLRPQLKLGSVIFAKPFIPKVAIMKQTVSAGEPVEKYMVYSDGDGHAMKLPKKLFDFIACVKEDIRCQQQMQQLQQKFAETAIVADFTGVLELLKNLKENQ